MTSSSLAAFSESGGSSSDRPTCMIPMAPKIGTSDRKLTSHVA